MATPTAGRMAPVRGSVNDWPASRLLAMVGGVLGLLMALALWAGMFVITPAADLPMLAGATFLGAAGLLHLILALLVLASAYALLGNPRLHGALLVVWGVVGLFLGFGFWIGALLVLIGGALALARPSGATMGRRPAY